MGRASVIVWSVKKSPLPRLTINSGAGQIFQNKNLEVEMERSLKDRLTETVESIRKESKAKPKIGIILGTGLGGLSQQINAPLEIPYARLPYFPIPTVATHKGALIIGKIANCEVVICEGRFHYYEGYSLQEVTYPVRVMRALGVETLLVSNAAGGMNPLFSPGDIMAISDHINFMGINPLIGPNDDSLGPRFPDMCEPYDSRLIKLAEEAALAEGIRLQKGVYIGVTGPNLETRAEYRFMRLIGADAVGMSTVPEVIVAVHAGMRVLGFSIITDSCLPDALKPVNIQKIIRTANEAEPKLTRLVVRVIEKL